MRSPGFLFSHHLRIALACWLALGALVAMAGGVAPSSEHQIADGMSDKDPAQPASGDDSSELPASGSRAAHLVEVREWIRTGRYEDARSALASMDALDAEGRFLQATVARILGQYAFALESLRDAVRMAPDHAGSRVVLGQVLEMLGRREQAIEAYRWFDTLVTRIDELPRDAAWLTDVSIGFMRYSVLTRTRVSQRTKYVLHELLQQAYERVDRQCWRARIAAGDLLREKFSNGEEDGSVSDYLAALKIDEDLSEAHVGLGWVRLNRWDFEAVEERVEKALAVNDRYAPALHLLASKFILERRYTQAESVCDRALKINENDLEALSLKAAAAACRYDQDVVDTLEARVRRINPRCARFYQALADALGGIRQYAASEQAYLKAIEFDDTNANARAELGLMFMQWGDEQKAREAMEGAWALDRFNQRTKFTLDLLDSLERFHVHETAHFIVKSDPAKDPLLAEMVGSYLEEIYDDVTADYAHPLSRKTVIELFPSSKSFAVRITGKPWIYTVGACTGSVIALASPKKAPGSAGSYNLASVLKHEFTHTVTLSATQNRIPHWFTEGLAVYQEDAPRSFQWQRLLAEAARRDELFTLESIDWGFIRPRKPTDRQMAYAQSEWMCEYIVERFGYDVLNRMLMGFRQRQTSHEVFEALLGSTPEVFTTDFVAWARKQIASWGFDLAKPENVEERRNAVKQATSDAGLWGRLAKAEFDAGAMEEALAAAKKAIDLEATNADGLEVFCTIVAMAMGQMHSTEERRAYHNELLPALEALSKIAPNRWVAPKYLAEIHLDREEYDQAIAPLKRLQHLCPADPASWRGLAGVYLEQDRLDDARVQLLELARLDENDAAVRARLGRIFRLEGAGAEARYWYRQALFIEPFSTKTNEALADLNMQLDDITAALKGYRLLTLLKPGTLSFLEKAAFAATKLGRDAQAREFAERAVRLSPESAARTLLD